MAYETLDVAIADGIQTVTLNRPERLNAFTATMADELEHVFRSANTDDEVRAIVVTGAGRGFCAGMDIHDAGDSFALDRDEHVTPSQLIERFDEPAIRTGVRDAGGRVTLAVFDCIKPVLAAINGPAVGVGATMTLAMDVRLASDQARIGFVFGKLGIVPEACSSWFLPRLVGLSAALELAYSARILSAAEALQIGLVRSVHPADDLLPAAIELARSFVDNRSPVATALTRSLMWRCSGDSSPLQAHIMESLAIRELSAGDGAEGVAAFQQRRPPEFTSKASVDLPDFYPWWPAAVTERGSRRPRPKPSR